MSATPNIKEYSVSELSGDIRRVVEDSFSYVRVKGELGRVMKAGSGHMYMDLKDDRAVISGVIWKGNAAKLSIRPEQGMEVVATGRLTTFPGQSKYQIVIESLEPAGAGALMALLEERKKKLHAEGLFDEARKRPLPYLPSVIGVVTSPSGAVIRDILHRLRDRFPVHVIVWPTLVQGQGAAAQIVRGIEGFNALPEGGAVPRPDVLIVARGGGSLEDLWCFNEEEVARAAAASAIPLISAVGHETDTTLIDYVSDRRAPTPTAAAEIAVPVRNELLAELYNKARRLTTCTERTFESRRVALISANRGLGRPEKVLDIPAQRLDRAEERLSGALSQRLERAGNRLGLAASGIRPQALQVALRQHRRQLDPCRERLGAVGQRFLNRYDDRLTGTSKLLESLSYKNVMQRGYALVLDGEGHVLRSAGEPQSGQSAEIRFHDGSRQAVFDGEASEAVDKPAAKKPAQKAAASKKPAPKKPVKPPTQKTLFD